MAKKEHRGRFQAQGEGIEESESWSQDEPLTKSDGLNLLDRLKNKLSAKDLDKRRKAFEKTERFISGAQGGVDAPKKKSFYDDKQRRDIRVDVEILSGKAFIVLIFLIILLAAWIKN